MIHQVTQLHMQSIDEENNKYFISSHKMYHFVPIYNQRHSFSSHYSDLYGDNKYTHYTVHLNVSWTVGLIKWVSNTSFCY